MNYFRKILFKFKDWKLNKQISKQRAKKGFANCDIWALDYWFSDTGAKMFYALRDRKHGASQLKFEEVDDFPIDWIEEQTKTLLKQKEEKGYDEEIDFYGENSCFDRWWLILSRIGWCLEQTNDEITEIENEYSEEYNRQVWGDDNDNLSFKDWWNKYFVVEEVDEKGKPKTYRLNINEPDEDIKKKYFDKEEEIRNYRERCKDEAFDLIKKYFYALWD